jgi:type I restriction enzyme S subunit
MGKYRLSTIADFDLSALSSKSFLPIIQYLDTSSITDNTIDSFQILNLSDAPSRAKRRVKDNTIVYSTVRPRLRHYGILSHPRDNVIVSTGFTTIDIKDEYKNEIDPYYLFVQLTRTEITNFLGTIADTAVTSYPSINPSDIEALEFDFPTIEEQKKIASVLRSIDDKIAINTSLCRRLEQTARDLYDYYFNNVQISHEGCETSTVKDQFDVLFGYPFSTELFTEEETDKPVIRIRDILTRTISAYSIEDVDIRYLLHEQDLLIGMDGNFHMNLWDGKWAFLNQRCCRIRQCGDLNTKYLYYQIYPYIKAKEAQAKGSTVGHLSNDEIRDLPVIVPPSNIAIEFNSKIEPIVKQQIMTSRASEDLTRLRDWLLPIMMSGQTNIE